MPCPCHPAIIQWDDSVVYDFTIAQLFGGPDKTLVFPGRYAGTSCYPHCLTVTDPDGFSGIWSSRDTSAQIVLPATAEHTLALSHVIATNRMFLTVPTAGTSARVASIRGDGAIDKKGAGDLRIESMSGADLKLFVQEGNVTLDGIPRSVDAPVDGALYHFDAARLDTMTYAVDSEGRTNVTRWASLGGGGMYAYLPSLAGSRSGQIKYAHAPFVSAATSPTGLPMLDFGSPTVTDVATLGPTNCLLNLSRADGGSDAISIGGSTEIREVFYAGYHLMPSIGVPLFTGYADSEHDYLSGGVKWRYSDRNAKLAVLLGEHSYNGLPADNCMEPAGRPLDAFHVYSCAATANTTVRYLATDRLYPKTVGGWRVGEILMYTNELTRAQRNQVNRYLMKKWMGQDDCDANAVVLSANAGTLGVAENNTANVRRLTVNGAKLVKTGAGTLAVDHVSPKTLDVEVQGGVFAVTSDKTPVTDNAQPADDPYLWLDAERGLTCTNAEGSSVRYVTKWSDWRNDGVHTAYAEIPTDNKYYYGYAPRVMDVSANGRDIVTFNPNGVQNENQQSWMRIQPSGENGYEAFVAVRADDGYSKHTIFGSTSDHFNCSYYNPLASDRCGAAVATALWTHNGTAIDPWTFKYTYDKRKTVQVFSVSVRSKTAFDLLAKYRTDQETGAGRLDIGEFLVYDRHLTDAERRDTIAYLTRKWNQTESADCAQPLCFNSLTFANDAEPILASDEDVDVLGMTGAEGKTLVKRGTGAASLDDGGMASISVEEGELTVSMTADPCANAMMHFDAADLASLTYQESSGTTNVIKWSDTRANGVVATSVIDTSHGEQQMAFSYPTLKTVETTSGVWRQVVDFGHRNNCKAATKYEDAAAMTVNSVVPDRTSREVHVVWCDATGGLADMCTSRGTKYYDFYRYGARLIRGDWCPEVANGDFWVDGTVTDPTTFKPGTSAYVLSSVPTSSVAFTSLFMDRNCNAGGGWYGEVVAFSNVLTSAARTQLIANLRKKWFGVSFPCPDTRTFDSVTVAAGAKLTVPDCVCLRAKAIDARGTIDVNAVASESWSFGYRNAQSWDSVTVNGAVVFDSDSVVTVTAADSHAVAEGEYELVSASQIDGLPKLKTVNFPSYVITRFVRDGKLVMKVKRRGVMMIIR